MVSENEYAELAAIEKLRYAVRIKQSNEQLLEHFASSLWWLIHYSEKHNIPLPEKDKIIQAVERAMKLAENIPPTNLQQPNRTPDKDNRTLDKAGLGFNKGDLQC